MIVFRHADPRFPFLWESADQPPARWHGEGEGPVHYFADTPDGAWAEFLRHEEMTTPEDVATIRRALWAVELQEEPGEQPRLPIQMLTGGRETYSGCRGEARRLREGGARGDWWHRPQRSLRAERMGGESTGGFSEGRRVADASSCSSVDVQILWDGQPP